jgi:hypothetical protein
MITGDFIVADRDADHRALSYRKMANARKMVGYAGIGIAMETLIESTVRETIRHSDNAPIASEAATALVSRDEATGAERPLKPAAPGDRIMVRNPSLRGRISPQQRENFAGIADNIAAAGPRKWRKHGGLSRYARYSRSYARYSLR